MPNIFQGKHVRLCVVEVSDWEIHYTWDFDTDNGRLTDEVWFPSSRESVRAWAEEEARNGGKNDVFRFQIENLEGELVGTINTHTCNCRCGTFMYGVSIMPQHRRKGYASEAIWLLLRYFFQERHYQKVNVEIYSFNEASVELHQALGFIQEGRLRRMIYTEGSYHDTLIFGMTHEEFLTKQPFMAF